MENNQKKLNINGRQLLVNLEAISRKKTENNNREKGRFINVAGVGNLVSQAYEQLRNAAENAQESLLLRRAMRRFFTRELFIINGRKDEITSKEVAEDLIIELTQAGYLKNNTQPLEVIDDLAKIIKKCFHNYRRIIKVGIDEKKTQGWTLDLVTMGCERILKPDMLQEAYIEFAYHHYCATIPKKIFPTSDEDNYEASLYVAVHRSLIKSDISAVRYDMQRLYKISDEVLADYIKFHEGIDAIFSSDITNELTRHIDRYGAPLRIFYSWLQDHDDAYEILIDKERFAKDYKKQIEKEYKKAGSRLNKSLGRSIAFLLITKSLIGLGIEVPYDLLTIGMVLLIPLLVNLLTPVAYLVLLRFSAHLPGEVNTEALELYASDMLYGDQKGTKLYPMKKEKQYSTSYTVAYAIMFIAVFGFVVCILNVLQFSIVQGFIFFIFLAAASFLGFRLLKIVKELEIETARHGFLIWFREFFFMPFTALGKWMSDKYQQVNIVALVLDTCIELPLKTVLRLIRQWSGFLDDKQSRI